MNKDNNPEITITIAGAAKTGKTTFGHYIALALNKIVGGGVIFKFDGEETADIIDSKVEKALTGEMFPTTTILIQDVTDKKYQPDAYTNAIEMYDALLEVKEFLGHIEPRVGEQAFAHIWGIVEQAIKSAE